MDCMEPHGNRRRQWLALATALLLVGNPASACRYCVRDTGFVEFDASPWILRVSGLPNPTAALWEKAARARLLEANVRLDTSTSASTSTDSQPPRVALLGPATRTLDLAPPSPFPQGETEIAQLLETVAMSPARDRLHDLLLKSFAVLLLIEGTQTEANASARRIADDAIQAFTPQLRKLPKPTDLPPRLLSLSPAEQTAESILLWSLGTWPSPTPAPRLVVLFGRGRSLGPAIEGPLITRSSLIERLRLVGQDCECDLDRSSFQGPIFPARWDTHRQAVAARSLGFDPDNPLVRTEVSRIILRGNANPNEGRRPPSSGSDPLGLGYREQDVDADAQPDPDSDPDSIATPDPAANGGVDPAVSLTNASAFATTTPSPTLEQPRRQRRGAWIALLAAVPATLAAGAFLLLRRSQGH